MSNGMGMANSSQVQVDVANVDANIDELEDALASVGTDQLRTDVISSALPTGAATETTLNAVKTAVEILDNAIDGTEMQVDVVSSNLPTGAATEATLSSDLKRAYGGESAGDVSYLDGAVDETYDFHGVKVHEEVTLGANSAFTNVANAPGVGDILAPDYYPFKGTRFHITAGKATLVKA